MQENNCAHEPETKQQMWTRIIAQKKAPEIISENALTRSSDKRQADIVASNYCKILMLYRRDFEAARYSYN